MRLLRYTFILMGFALLAVMLVGVFIPSFVSLHISLEPKLQVVKYPFQYGFDSCKIELSTIGTVVLVVGDTVGDQTTYEAFLTSYPNDETTLSASLFSGTSHKMVVYDRYGTEGHAWIKTPDNSCPGMVYNVRAYLPYHLLL
jgi:hypothetical protein